MSSNAITVTTINSPTTGLINLAKNAGRLDAELFIVGDTKSPPDFSLDGSTYLNVSQQVATGLLYAEKAPVRHYSRKNIAYLCAIKNRCDIIIETDDDNIPREEFWVHRLQTLHGDLVSGRGWCNVYKCFSSQSIWPRGLPLFAIQQPEHFHRSQAEKVDSPIQQGLADLNPDVDAIYRLVAPLPVSFERRAPVILDYGVWCPFNSQNTTWFKPTFPLLYLPAYCSFRMTDIWRSFVAQRICWENNWRLSFHNATVIQERNEHNLMRDFEDEVIGYLRNDEIKNMLLDLKLHGGLHNIQDDLIICYKGMIGLGVIDGAEEPLLKAWIRDLFG
ncbi:MAG: STELLO glycosyltransferase family protein [Rhodomicrobium sp.]